MVCCLSLVLGLIVAKAMSSRTRPAPEMIDLDQYMRAPVRRTTCSPHNIRKDTLVVDHGRPPPLHHPVLHSSSSSDVTPQPDRRLRHAKRYSHDSGLSDGSFKKRRYRSIRRVAPVTVSSENDSLFAFRQVCERTLKEQQTQIARVTALCEQLAVRQSAPRASSDLSSTTRSSQECRDRHSVSQCKTYKIIMRKLDELNRVFTSKGSPRAARAPPPLSSGSVSVVDKVVATDDLAGNQRSMSPRVRTISPYRANIVMESVVQTDFPLVRHASTIFRTLDHHHHKFNSRGDGDRERQANPWAAAWRTLRGYLTLCLPHVS